MATCSADQPHIGPIHVDKEIVRKVLRAATSDAIKESDPNYVDRADVWLIGGASCQIVWGDITR